MISARTKAALQAAKARGVKLGGRRDTLRGGTPNEYQPDPARAREGLMKAAEEFAQQVGPLILAMRQKGISLRQIGAALTNHGVRTARGGAWSADAVRQVLLRVGLGRTRAGPVPCAG